VGLCYLISLGLLNCLVRFSSDMESMGVPHVRTLLVQFGSGVAWVWACLLFFKEKFFYFCPLTFTIKACTLTFLHNFL